MGAIQKGAVPYACTCFSGPKMTDECVSNSTSKRENRRKSKQVHYLGTDAEKKSLPAAVEACVQRRMDKFG